MTDGAPDAAERGGAADAGRPSERLAPTLWDLLLLPMACGAVYVVLRSELWGYSPYGETLDPSLHAQLDGSRAEILAFFTVPSGVWLWMAAIGLRFAFCRRLNTEDRSLGGFMAWPVALAVIYACLRILSPASTCIVLLLGVGCAALMSAASFVLLLVRWPKRAWRAPASVLAYNALAACGQFALISCLAGTFFPGK